MSSKDLQRVTDSASYIGQPSSRRSLPARRRHVTQKVRVAGQRTRYLSVHDNPQPAEIFLRFKGPDCSLELIGLYDVIALLTCRALQYDRPEKIGDLLAGAKFERNEPVSEHNRLNKLPWPSAGEGHNNGHTHQSSPPSRIPAALPVTVAAQVD